MLGLGLFPQQVVSGGQIVIRFSEVRRIERECRLKLCQRLGIFFLGEIELAGFGM
jgi:hypothetical protein